MNIEIKQINSVDTIDLRHQLLRQDQTREFCIYPGDDDPLTAHFGAFVDQQLSGIVSFYQENLAGQGDNGFRFRGMATKPEVRTKGIGMQLLKAGESYAFKSGAKYLWANARVSALGFYDKAKYTIIGDEFDIEGIGPHFNIIKMGTTKILDTK